MRPPPLPPPLPPPPWLSPCMPGARWSALGSGRQHRFRGCVSTGQGDGDGRQDAHTSKVRERHVAYSKCCTICEMKLCTVTRHVAVEARRWAWMARRSYIQGTRTTRRIQQRLYLLCTIARMGVLQWDRVTGLDGRHRHSLLPGLTETQPDCAVGPINTTAGGGLSKLRLCVSTGAFHSLTATSVSMPLRACTLAKPHRAAALWPWPTGSSGPARRRWSSPTG
jgi:hypothetical protein